MNNLINKDLIYSIFNSIDHPQNCYIMASMCTQFSKIYWENRIYFLRKIFINHLLNNDKNFINYMKKYKSIISNQGPQFIDDHNNEIRMIKQLCIVLQYKNKQILLVNQGNIMIHPKIWIFPTNIANIYQCKNPLYIKDNKIHLSTCSTGATLHKEYLKELHQNSFLIQKYIKCKDVNILLTLDQFNQIF